MRPISLTQQRTAGLLVDELSVWGAIEQRYSCVGTATEHVLVQRANMPPRPRKLQEPFSGAVEGSCSPLSGRERTTSSFRIAAMLQYRLGNQFPARSRPFHLQLDQAPAGALHLAAAHGEPAPARSGVAHAIAVCSRDNRPCLPPKSALVGARPSCIRGSRDELQEAFSGTARNL
jgi:hypothetical protein